MYATLIYLEWVLMTGKFIMLALLSFVAKDSLKSLIFGRPRNDKRVEFEHSLFILISTVLVFQFISRIASDTILAAEMGLQAKRQFYYIFLSIFEALFIVAIIQWHSYKKCEFARVTTYMFYVTGLIIALLLSRYVDRVVFDTNYLDNVYSHLIVSKNIFIDVLIYSYPLYRFIQLTMSKLKLNG